ncbi:flagellar assembly protein FliW [Alkalibacillus aidingensis]|uniref:flagellar assembly protein FliW n=1 Tax=Alkalibacillus aidingensis TaxID=2747607 RepID=UPI0016617E1E|nr:flagellar assembly protein FliW [Alkalibacillus aidingensis]
MKITTVYFGDIEINEKQLINFENGLPGFQDEKEFALLDLEGNPAFKVMQSTKTKELAFVITNPFLVYPDYEFKLDDNTVDQLSVKKPEHVSAWSIVTLKEPFEQSTINLQAPVVINTQNRQAKQVSLNHTKYHTKHSIKGGEQEDASTHTKTR